MIHSLNNQPLAHTHTLSNKPIFIISVDRLITPRACVYILIHSITTCQHPGAYLACSGHQPGN